MLLALCSPVPSFLPYRHQAPILQARRAQTAPQDLTAAAPLAGATSAGAMDMVLYRSLLASTTVLISHILQADPLNCKQY